MKLEFNDAVHCAKVFEDYFGSFDRIDEYMRDQKLNSLAELPSNPLFPIEDELFQDFTMNPKDMNFEVVEIDNETWTKIYTYICIVVQRNSGVIKTLRNVCPFKSYTLIDTVLEKSYLIIFTNSIVQVYITPYYVAWSKGIAVFIVTNAVVYFGPFEVKKCVLRS
jgi:hypothetical protein